MLPSRYQKVRRANRHLTGARVSEKTQKIMENSVRHPVPLKVELTRWRNCNQNARKEDIPAEAGCSQESVIGVRGTSAMILVGPIQGIQLHSRFALRPHFLP